ncbi:nucleotide-diphospho-sugar transferase [Emericellopsis atlantica]|uniref:Nucleotide-diphospho-sugar transferase n=1 Tax=Emericellopsis atlantica TaxID=2614577 RepID=A0A9P8CJX1_9HYPO|nr:nucleotide-diphospho-sugar transferase [Emericellopsis atlantica]KAG9249914.1 nucleotide-diphospho-sugar transferase [Emericellopsis atlantica]
MAVHSAQPPPVPDSPKVWASLITNMSYLPGLLTLHHTLSKTSSAYPFVAIITASLPAAAVAALHSRRIPTVTVEPLLPSHAGNYANDPRFRDTWTKLTAFGLDQFERIVLLDSDMLITKNLDELMDLELDAPPRHHGFDGGPGVDGETAQLQVKNETTGRRVLAASPACTCNPAHKKHYPADWVPANCAYTSQHATPDLAQTRGPERAPLGVLNSGLLVVNPSKFYLSQITTALEDPATADMAFPDQDLLADLYRDRWVVLPYIYNALKTLRWKGVHDTIWRQDEVKVVHYIWSPKPWSERNEDGAWAPSDESHAWWHEANEARHAEEKRLGLYDGH